MNKTPRLSDRELVKWIEILGAKEIEYLHIKDKIRLTSAQLDKVFEMKTEPKDRITMVKEIVEKEREINR